MPKTKLLTIILVLLAVFCIGQFGQEAETKPNYSGECFTLPDHVNSDYSVCLDKVDTAKSNATIRVITGTQAGTTHNLKLK